MGKYSEEERSLVAGSIMRFLWDKFIFQSAPQLDVAEHGLGRFEVCCGSRPCCCSSSNTGGH